MEQQNNKQVAALDLLAKHDDVLDAVAHNRRVTTSIALAAGTLVSLSFAVIGFAAARRQSNN